MQKFSFTDTIYSVHNVFVQYYRADFRLVFQRIFRSKYSNGRNTIIHCDSSNTIYTHVSHITNELFTPCSRKMTMLLQHYTFLYYTITQKLLNTISTCRELYYHFFTLYLVKKVLFQIGIILSSLMILFLILWILYTL